MGYVHRTHQGRLHLVEAPPSVNLPGLLRLNVTPWKRRDTPTPPTRFSHPSVP